MIMYYFTIKILLMEVDYVCKVLCIGDLRSGKTTLVETYIGGKYLPPECRNSHKDSIDYHTQIILVDDKKVKLQIWDTGGQERFRSITKSSCQGAAVILIMYDVTDQVSFHNVKMLWYPQVKTFTPHAKIILVANKSDSDQRQVSLKQGISLADELAVPFFEVNAKNMNGVNKLFNSCAKIHFDYQQEMKGDKIKEEEISLFKKMLSYIF